MTSPASPPALRPSPTAGPLPRSVRVASSPVFPRRFVSWIAGRLSCIPIPRAWREPLFLAYARRTGANLREAEYPPVLYRTFREFFGRRLAPGSRRTDPDPEALVSPADGTVVEAGSLVGRSFLQAKGVVYDVGSLLGGDDLAEAFAGGTFVTIYLAPGDYHRFHAPATGRVVEAVRVPGALFPVLPSLALRRRRLFCGNERLTTVLETAAGRLALVAVGALNVSGIRVVYDESRHLRRGRAILRKRYVDGRGFRKGDEVGAFEFGSTLVCLFPPGAGRLEPLGPGHRVRVGERIATATPSRV